MYHTLRVLFEERNCEQFQVLLNSALQQWQQDPELEYFYQYFVNEYTEKCSEWALSYRKNAGVNTNMYLESFHRVLKHCYKKSTVNKKNGQNY